MRRIRMLAGAAVAAFCMSAGANEPSTADKMRKSLDEANETVNRELAKARRNTADAVDKANDKTNKALEKGRAKVPGLKKLQKATNNR